MDRQWLKNLAQSCYTKQGWQLADPSNPPFIAHTRVQDALEILFEKVRENIEIFNMHADDAKQMRLYRLSRHPQAKACGFMILIARIQIKIEQVGADLRTDAVIMQGYKSLQVPMRVFQARFDTFGDVAWIMDQSYPMNLDKLAKQILEDSCRIAYETGSLPAPAA